MTNSVLNSSSLSSGQYINISALVYQSTSSIQKNLSTLQSKSTNINTNISTIGNLKSSISNLQDDFKNIVSSMNKYNVSSSKDIPNGITINLSTSGLFNIGVSQLASSQINTFNQIFGTGALGFSGTLTLNSGNYSNSILTVQKSINISIDTSDTISDISNKINNAGLGINANIISTPKGQYLSLSSATGENNAFNIVANDPSNSGLNNLSMSLNSSNTQQISVAQNSLANINGVSISSDTNTFSSVPGISITANNTFSTQQFSSSLDTKSLSDSISKFVKDFNQTNLDIKNSNLNEHSLNNFISNLRDNLNSSSFSLSQMGISFDKTGVMNFDSTKFNNLNSNTITSDLNTTFKNNTKIDDLFSSILDSSSGTLANDITNYESQLKNLNSSISDTQSRLSSQQQFYQKQYSKLDGVLSGLNNNLQTVTALMQQFNKSSN